MTGTTRCAEHVMRFTATQPLVARRRRLGEGVRVPDEVRAAPPYRRRRITNRSRRTRRLPTPPGSPRPRTSADE
ncbi:hypothetical protein ACFPM0_34230 [Pseudonocardia sulfidoxydans]|uniref:hypothetical protein n=1 Tax=Pseudonocardia sulfidoxydans TaxID=54011 RepID=UPI00362007CE